MWISVYFGVYNSPITSLTPTIRIRYVLDGSIVDSGVMTEVGDGFYNYDFSSYDSTKEYCMICDAVTLPNNIRYKFLTSGEYGDIINTVEILSDNIDTRSLLIKKILSNKLYLFDGDTNNWVLYDDDDSVLTTWNIIDKDGNGIIEESYSSSRRSKGC